MTTFGSYLRNECKISDRRAVLHSLRHTVKQLLQEAGAPDRLVADVLGHAGRETLNSTYGDGTSLREMRQWTEKLPLREILIPSQSSGG